MTVFDSVTIPILTTDKNGCILYKNNAAKRSVPTPKTGGNITRYICTEKWTYANNIDGARIVYIENSKSIFKRAFVLIEEERDIWLFLSELQLGEPEDIANIPRTGFEAFAKSVKSLLDDSKEIPGDPSPQRFHRMEAELLRILKIINFERDTRVFSVTDILTSLSEATKKLAAALNFRIRFNFNVRDSEMGFRIRFAPFAMLYTYTLLFMLRQSNKSECYVEVLRIEDLINFSFRTNTDHTGTNSCGKDFSQLAEMFEQDQLNLMLITQSSALNKFLLNWSLTEYGDLTFNLTMSLDNTKGMILFQPLRPEIVRLMFNRKNKRVIEFLNSMFLQMDEDI